MKWRQGFKVRALVAYSQKTSHTAAEAIQTRYIKKNPKNMFNSVFKILKTFPKSAAAEVLMMNESPPATQNPPEKEMTWISSPARRVVLSDSCHIFKLVLLGVISVHSPPEGRHSRLIVDWWAPVRPCCFQLNHARLHCEEMRSRWTLSGHESSFSEGCVQPGCLEQVIFCPLQLTLPFLEHNKVLCWLLKAEDKLNVSPET